MEGVIKKLVQDKGFGFIRDARGTEYFFHKSSCVMPFELMHEGDSVGFDPIEHKKGPRADNVGPVN